MTHLLFLPGAGGAAEFWHPLGTLLPEQYDKTYLNWPGLGHEAHRPGFDSLEALTTHAAAHLKNDTVVVAQSMGGIFALRLGARAAGEPRHRPRPAGDRPPGRGAGREPQPGHRGRRGRRP